MSQENVELAREVLDTLGGWMLKFRDAKVLHFRAFREPAEALEAVGLSE
jgi:hypothetical protein